ALIVRDKYSGQTHVADGRFGMIRRLSLWGPPGRAEQRSRQDRRRQLTDRRAIVLNSGDFIRLWEWFLRLDLFGQTRAKLERERNREKDASCQAQRGKAIDHWGGVTYP